ncbi:MAG: ThuA domain-containing protein [Planctomycetes bacterium]|nr:ThuA domain-containing protein [Planctomycetota bacterium]
MNRPYRDPPPLRGTASAIAALAALSTAIALSPLESEEAAKPARVLIVTGSDVGAHDWRATTPVTRRILEESKRFEVYVAEDASVLESSGLSRYDLIVLNYRNDPNKAEEKLSEAARKNLVAFVKGGKGLAALHFAVNAWGDWDEYAKLIGRTWVGRRAGGEKVSGHGPRGPFKVKVTAKDHAITKGVEDFEIDDELYARLAGDAAIEVLATAHSADYSKRDEPMAWTLRYGEGRVFVTVLGHDARARENAGFQRLLVQGCAWAAGKG